MNARPDIAEGKSCGDCGLCCKLIGVESISKPQFFWCASYQGASAGRSITTGRARGLALLVWVGRQCFEITPDGAFDHGMVRPGAAERRAALR